jgi:hypothetical protein
MRTSVLGKPLVAFMRCAKSDGMLSGTTYDFLDGFGWYGRMVVLVASLTVGIVFVHKSL